MKQILRPALSLFVMCQLFLSPLFSSEEKFFVSPLKTERPPKIDGRLDDKVWKDAPMMTDFIQFEPHKGRLATVKTEVRVAYDDTYLYFGFKAFDSHPGKNRAGNPEGRAPNGNRFRMCHSGYIS